LRATAVFTLLLAAVLAFAHTDAPPGETASEALADTRTAVIDLGALKDIPGLVDRLAGKRVVFVGETHDRYEDHLNQLAIIKGLHGLGRDLAIGMEFFQQPFQPVLDDYVAGRISEQDMLRRTEYFERWRFDYRLYSPILRFAREQGIPLIALNIEREITEKVGQGGIAALSDDERARVPAEIDRDDPEYRKRLLAVFEHHPKSESGEFEHFLDVQLLWDEGMAERAARYLAEHPDKTLVVLAGTGHLEYGQGIPQRLLRRAPVESAVVLSGATRELEAGIADFLLYPQRVELPPAGLLGVLLDTGSPGEGVGVKGFAPGSGAKEAGVEEGDRIVTVASEPVASYSDVRIALIGGRPGEKVSVQVLRKRLLGKERLTFEVELR
jgi:uncharacterized iron-regulated protein